MKLFSRRGAVKMKKWNALIYRIFGFTVMLLPLITLYCKYTDSWNDGAWNGYLTSAFIISVVVLNAAIIIEILRSGINTYCSFKDKNNGVFVRHLLFLLFCIILLAAEILVFTAPLILKV